MTHAKGPSLNRSFAPGEVLFYEGEPSHCMYLVQKGTISIRKNKASEHVELARIYSNEVLGELSFFDRHPRSATAVALTQVEVLEIKFEALDKVYAQVPDFMKAFMTALADRLRKADDTIRRLQRNAQFSDSLPESSLDEAEIKETSSLTEPSAKDPEKPDPQK